MNSIFDNDDQHFQVVLNSEGQYSMWPIDWDVPVGWTPNGMRGSRADCMRHIDSVWTDMRPRSLVAAMDGESGRG